MRAHDVRKLRACALCTGLGSVDGMPLVEGVPVHDRCAVRTLGPEGVLALPASERAKFRLCATGPTLMARLVEAGP